MAILNLPVPTHNPVPGAQVPTSTIPRNGAKPVADSDNQPNAYQTANNVEVRYAPQSNGLTTPVDTVVTGPTRVLESSQRLLDGWRTAAGAPSNTEATGGVFGGMMAHMQAQQPDPTLTQVENDTVKVNHPSQQPLVHLDGGELEGDPHITSPFVTANQVHDTTTSELGRDIKYRSDDGRLNINVGEVSRPGQVSPYHSPNTGTLTFPAAGANGTSLATDPDVVAHEQGHAILNSQRPDIDFSPESKATHEAFSDGVAFFNSLKQDEVRADTIRRWDNPEGPQSGLASNISEAGPAYFGDKPTDSRAGLRDLSGDAPAGGVQDHGHHKDSVKFGSALHDSTRALYQDIRSNNPDLSAEQAFDQATSRVRSDFYRATDFLPPGGKVTQDDMAAAMMRANTVDADGQNREMYGQNFQEAGLRPVTADRIAQEAGLPALSEQISMPEGLRGQNYESKFDGADSPARQEAARFLEQNGAKLGIPDSYDMQPSRVYSNDRGETFMLFDGGKPGNMTAPREYLGVGFNSDGQLIHFDSAQQEPARRPPMSGFPQPPGGGFPKPTPGGGGFPLPGGGFPQFPPMFPGTGGPPPTGGSGNDQIPSGGSGSDQIPTGGNGHGGGSFVPLGGHSTQFPTLGHNH